MHSEQFLVSYQFREIEAGLSAKTGFAFILHNVLVDNLLISFEKNPDTPPLGQIAATYECKLHEARLLGKHYFLI